MDLLDMVFALVEVACRVAMNPEKAALYFCLAFLGGFLISVTVMCGSWMALKLAPVANDRTSMYSHRSTMTHTRFALTEYLALRIGTSCSGSTFFYNETNSILVV